MRTKTIVIDIINISSCTLSLSLKARHHHPSLSETHPLLNRWAAIKMISLSFFKFDFSQTASPPPSSCPLPDFLPRVILP